jgi:L-cysteate sulfo-lyase
MMHLFSQGNLPITLPMHLSHLPRFPLAQLPTPIETLPALSRVLGGPDLLIKRDDQTGLAFGGNKTRKLEFLVGQALAQDADTLVTAGAAQSNHCRQTAAAAAKAGLKCDLLLNQIALACNRGGGASPQGATATGASQPPDLPAGNLLLNELLGATAHWIERPQRPAKLRELPEQLRAQGRKPYVIPVGGSNGVGATGYVLAMHELMAQLGAGGQRVDHIVFGSSSGGTQAGMVLGARLAGFTGQLHGVSIDKSEPEHEAYEEEVAQIANECAAYIGSEVRVTRGDIKVIYGYMGEGYGVVGHLEHEAIRLMARHEGILLDPVYAGRAFGALVDIIRKGGFKRGETVLFWHTGGAPALFAYARELLAPA